MARIRSLKPEFWTAEQVMECSPLARLAFIGMWNFCDDAGIHPASAKTLKAEIFPSDDIPTAQVSEMVRELLSQGLIEEYEVDGRYFWAVTGWHHQKIDQPTYKHPRQDGTVPEGAPKRRASKPKPPVQPLDPPAPEYQGEVVRGMFGEHSPNERGVFTPGEERRGEERKGVNLFTTEERGSTTERVGEESEGKVFQPPVGTRKGLLCGLLRASGMADAAPHHLADEVWAKILAKRTDEEILEFAKAKMKVKPGVGLKYIAPGLLQDPETITPSGGARASPKDQRREEQSKWAKELVTAGEDRGHDDGRTIDV